MKIYIRCKFHIRRHKEVFISPRGYNERRKKSRIKYGNTRVTDVNQYCHVTAVIFGVTRVAIDRIGWDSILFYFFCFLVFFFVIYRDFGAVLEDWFFNFFLMDVSLFCHIWVLVYVLSKYKWISVCFICFFFIIKLL